MRQPLQPPVPSLNLRQPWKPSLNILAALGSDLVSGQVERPSSGCSLRYSFTTELVRSSTSVNLALTMRVSSVVQGRPGEERRGVMARASRNKETPVITETSESLRLNRIELNRTGEHNQF